jgi:glycosyl transferase family 25
MRFSKLVGVVLGASASLFLALFFWADGFFILPPSTHVQDPWDGQETSGVCVYYLNLDRAVERRQRLERLMRAMPFPFQRVVGVDSVDLSDKQLLDYVDPVAYQKFYGRVPQKGEVLCTHSHIQAWRTFLDSRYAYALILEDDTIFDPAEMAFFVSKLTEKHHLWDVCNLDTRAKGAKRFRLTLGQIGDRRRSVGHRLYGADAYLISRDAARKLLSHVTPLRLEIENYFSRAWELGYKYTDLSPVVATCADASLSRHLRLPDLPEDKKVNPVWRRVTHRIYRLKTGLAQFIHAFRVYLTVQ